MTAFMYPWLLLLAVPVLLAALFAWKRKFIFVNSRFHADSLAVCKTRKNI